MTTSRDIFNKKKAKTEGALYKDLFMPTLSLRWYVVMLYLPSKKITKTETMCKNCERKISNCYGMEWKSNQASPNVQNKSILGLILEHTILLLSKLKHTQTALSFRPQKKPTSVCGKILMRIEQTGILVMP